MLYVHVNKNKGCLVCLMATPSGLVRLPLSYLLTVADQDHKWPELQMFIKHYNSVISRLCHLYPVVDNSELS